MVFIREQLNSILGDFYQFGDFFLLGLIFLFSVLIYIIVKKIVVKILTRLIKKTRIEFDDHLLNSKVFDRITLLVPVLIIYNSAYLFPPGWLIFLQKSSSVFLAFVTSLTVTSLLNGLGSYYSTLEISKIRPIKGYVQVINIIIYLIALIFAVGIITGESVWELLAGLGALTAVLLLIFRDTILSFVASLQIAGNDLVHLGDWIEMPKYGADGDVIDIALHTIKVQNWDKTITVIPTHKLIEESFKNWRGMQAAGGRRIKRSVFIDLNTITFCSKEMLDRFEKIKVLTDYIKSKRIEITEDEQDYKEEIINKRRLTNIGTFRAYAERYVKAHPKVHQDMTCMVRQLAPGPNGLPMEIYVFTNDTAWINYETIQADIFDHLLAIIPEFGLKVYQQPSGQDMSRIHFVPAPG